MRNAISKALVAGLAALSLTVTVFATAQPAAAEQGRAWHGGGWHGHRHGGAGWWGPAVVGGLAAGALLAAPYYSQDYRGSCYAYSPMYDEYGNYIGQQTVNVC